MRNLLNFLVKYNYWFLFILLDMRNLLNFLVKYNYWFLFILLEVASFVLLFRFNRYQQSVFFTSANVVAGKLYEVTGSIAAYFHLKETNEDLLDHNIVSQPRLRAA